MPVNWMHTRLAVVLDNDVSNPLTPVDSFTPSFAINTEVVHSIEATHVGYIANPESFTFTMSVKAMGVAAAKLMQLAMSATEFEIGLYEQSGGGGEWAFQDVVFRKCLITSATPTTASATGAPTATFSGVARQAETKSTEGDVTRPAFTA